MNEQELTSMFHSMFEKIDPILIDVKKGFLIENLKAIREDRDKFGNVIVSALPFVEEMIEKKDKTDVEKRFVNLVLALQSAALAIENLLGKMEMKVANKILFSQKALNEIEELFSIMQTQFRDAKDYILTRNPHLRGNIKNSHDSLIKLIGEYELIHQNRLIIGVCMPKASYLYIDITDSIKRISRSLVELSEKV